MQPSIVRKSNSVLIQNKQQLFTFWKGLLYLPFNPLEYFLIPKESEESDDDDEDEKDDDDEVLTLEDLKKTEAYKLAMEGLAAMRAKEARHNETDSRKLNEKLQSTEACEIIKWS